LERHLDYHFLGVCLKKGGSPKLDNQPRLAYDKKITANLSKKIRKHWEIGGEEKALGGRAEGEK